MKTSPSDGWDLESDFPVTSSCPVRSPVSTSFTHLTPISLSSSSTTLQCSEEKESTANKAEEWARGTGFWRCFAALCVPILLSAFEGSVVSTALPTISLALDLGPNSSWVATAFLLASIVFQPLFGQLADIWGRRHLMMIAVVIFGAGSAVAGYANNCAVLIFGRIIQGVGSGGIDLFAELILCDIIPLKKRGYYVAIKAAVYALGTTVGPLLGGVFAQTNWRWCFGVNLPICIIALVLMWFWLQLKTGDSGLSVLQQVGQVDYLGIVLLTTAVVLILCVLSLAGTVYSWSDPTIVVSLAGGFSGIVAFIFWQRSRRCAHPIMAPYVFSNRTTIAALAITAIHGFITYGFQFYLPPFFQAVLGASPSQSGVLILPCSLTIVVLAAIGGPLLARFGKYRLMHVVGFALLVVGLLPCITGSVALWIWILLSFLVGTGSGLIVSTTLPTVLVELTDKENAAATGSWAFLRGLGSLLGVAIPNAVFNAQFSATLLHNKIDDELARSELRDGQAYQHASASFISKFDKQTREEILGAFTASFKLVWIIFLSLAVVGLFATFLERQVRLRRDLDSDFGLKDPQRG